MQTKVCVHRFEQKHLLFLLMLTLLASCGMPTPSTNVRARIKLSSKILKTHSPQLLAVSQPTHFAPLDVKSFTCYFVNVMGPGIGNWDRNGSAIIQNPGSSEFSLYSTTIDLTNESTVEIDVPYGSQRIFQAIGVVSTKVCRRTLTAANIADANVFKGVFELGRSVLDIQSDQNISITSAYDPFTVKDARLLFDPTIANLDKQAPIPGSLIQASRNNESISLTWLSADDGGGTPAKYLLYKLISGTSSDAINSIGKAETSGITVVDWTLDLRSYTGPSSRSLMAYTVLVQDSAGNIGQYTPVELPGLPELSYEGVNGALTLGVAVTLTPTTLKGNGASITSCSVKSGSSVRLPSWASINQTTCVIKGTPNARLSATVITIVASNSGGSSADATILLSVQ